MAGTAAGALMAHLLRAPRAIQIGMWVYLGLTFPATIYFGWHYIVDDMAGVLIGLAAVVLAAKATGHELRPHARTHSVPAVAQTARAT